MALSDIQKYFIITTFLLFGLIADVKSDQLKFAVVPNYPATYCQNAGDQGTDLISGFEIEYFVKVMESLNLVENDPDGFVIVCQPSYKTAIQNGLFNQYSEYDGALGGIPISSTLVELGYQYSLPTIVNGLSVLQNFDSPKSFISQAISWKAILLIIFTIFIASILFIMFEHKNIYYVDYFFHTFSSFFMVKEQFLVTSSAKMIQLVFWLLGLIFMMFMISNMVLEYIRQYGTKVINFGQLNGKVIYAESLYSNYTTDFLSYSENLTLSTTQVNVGSFMEDNEIEFALVETFKADLAEYSTCSIINAIKNAYDLNFGILYQTSFSSDKIKEINKGILQTYLSSEPTSFQENYIKENFSKCKSSKKYYRELKVKIEDYYPCIVCVLSISIVALFWNQIKRKIRKVYPNLFYPFETQYGRRKRDRHIAKQCREKWKIGLKDVICEMRKENVYRVKGIEMLKDFIQKEKRFKQNQLALAYDSVLQQIPSNEILIQDNIMLQKLIMELEGQIDLDSQEQLIDVNDITRQTPLTEYFLNRPKTERIYIKLQEKAQEEEYFQKDKNQGKNLFLDLTTNNIVNKNQIDDQNQLNNTQNQLQNNFKLTILKQRKNNKQETEVQNQNQLPLKIINTQNTQEEEKIPIKPQITQEPFQKEADAQIQVHQKADDHLEDLFGTPKPQTGNQKIQSSKSQSGQRSRSQNQKAQETAVKKDFQAERSYQDDSQMSDLKNKKFVKVQNSNIPPNNNLLLNNNLFKNNDNTSYGGKQQQMHSEMSPFPQLVNQQGQDSQPKTTHHDTQKKTVSEDATYKKDKLQLGQTSQPIQVVANHENQIEKPFTTEKNFPISLNAQENNKMPVFTKPPIKLTIATTETQNKANPQDKNSQKTKDVQEQQVPTKKQTLGENIKPSLNQINLQDISHNNNVQPQAQTQQLLNEDETQNQGKNPIYVSTQKLNINLKEHINLGQSNMQVQQTVEKQQQQPQGLVQQIPEKIDETYPKQPIEQVQQANHDNLLFIKQSMPKKVDNQKQLQSAPQQKMNQIANEIVESDDEFDLPDIEIQQKTETEKKQDQKQQFLANLKIKTSNQPKEMQIMQVTKPLNLQQQSKVEAQDDISIDDLTSNKSSEVGSQMQKQKSTRILHNQKSLESQQFKKNLDQASEIKVQTQENVKTNQLRDSFDQFLDDDDNQKKKGQNPEKSNNFDEISVLSLDKPSDLNQIPKQEKSPLTNQKPNNNQKKQQQDDDLFINLD